MLGGLTLKMKLSLGFGATLVLLLAVGVIGYEATTRMGDANERAVTNLEKSRIGAQMTAALEKQSTGVRGFLLQGKENLLKHDEEGQQEFQEASNRLEGMLVTERGKQLLAEIKTSFGRWRKYADQEVALKRAGKSKEAVELCFSGETSAVRNEVREALGQMEELENKLSNEAVEDGHRVEASTRLMLPVCALIGCGIGMTIAFTMTRSITQGTGEMVRMIRKIADNDLGAADLNVKSNDELGQAANALNEMKRKLGEIVQAMAASAEHVASASEEISSGARDSAETAKNQLGQTMQATTAMHEMTTTVQQISENSQAAADSSREAATLAEKGGEEVQEVLSSMRKISESTTKTATQISELGRGSEEIGKIVAVIDDIADQTNLLALNAAIEAARAGQQGRGFAVVADEVRKLAERTTKATKEIAGMIETIQRETKNAVAAMEQAKQEVEAGVKKTSDSGEALKRIIATSQKVGDMIMQIATAATEQSAATEQVNGNVAHISSATQESAASAAQAAKACADLSEQALELQKIVGQFKVAEARMSGSPAHEAGRAMGAGAGG